ncbi:MAG: carbohydrate kinase, partial [Chloroflexota bacterium]
SAEYVFYRNPGADLMLKADELDREFFSQVKALHFGSVSLVDEPLLSTVKEAVHLARKVNALISFDVNHRPSLWNSEEKALERIWEMVPQANLLKVNEHELRLLCGMDDIDDTNPVEACLNLLKHGPELIVVTLGERGSFFCTQEAHAYMPPFKVTTVDAVGCGDAFIAGILTRLVRAADWRTRLTKEALLEDFRYANAVGALTATKQGVIPSLPTAEQVEQFLKDHA